ncbi:MAG TPA: glycosyl hydrolase family 18 protein [Micromonosporaceae bacterium]
MRRRLVRGATAIPALLALVVPAAACQPSRPPPPDGPHIVAGYLVPWDPRSTASGPALTEVDPVWYQPTDTGQVVFASDQARRAVDPVRADAAARKLLLKPSVSNFRGNRWDGALVHRIVSDPTTRAAHVAALVDTARTNGWPGLDVDYESLPASDRDAYSAFVSELADALHRDHRRLSVTVHAKTTEPGDWGGARAEDWRALGRAADQVRVMAYDYSYASSEPGSVAPMPWVEQVVRLAVSEMPRDRILLGVGTYGYDWTAGQPGRELQWTDVEALARARGVPVAWDPVSQSSWFSYTDDQGHPHTVWYENARSLAAKVDLATRYRLAGVSIWRLGGEDPAIWPTLHPIS